MFWLFASVCVICFLYWKQNTNQSNNIKSKSQDALTEVTQTASATIHVLSNKAKDIAQEVKATKEQSS